MQMGTIKDRNSMDLKEAEDKKRCQEYTEELYKKDVLFIIGDWNAKVVSQEVLE